jgi:hypothetical protein
MSSWCWKQGDVSAIVWNLCLVSRGNEQESRVQVEFCWVLKEASTREGADEAESRVQEQMKLSLVFRSRVCWSRQGMLTSWM